MSDRNVLFLTFASCALLLMGAGPAHQLEEVTELPEGVPPEIAAQLDTDGYRITGPKGILCDLWFLKQVEIAADFEPKLNIKYPFASGQLVGLIRVEKKSRYTDFRGQRIRSGLHTLRYGQQPEDGNHIGTSVIADYLLAVPAKNDTSTETISGAKKLTDQSAKAVRGTHPAIFSLMEVKTAAKQPTLEHDEEHEFWILNFAAKGSQNGKSVDVPIRMVTVGQAEG